MNLLHDHDGSVDHAAHLNGNEGKDNRYRNSDDRNNGTREVPQENEDHQADNDELFQQGVLQVVDGAVDQIRTIIGSNDLQSFRQTRHDIGQLGFDSLDGFFGVLAEAHDYHSSDRLAFAVEFAYSTAHLRTICVSVVVLACLP